MNPPALIAFDLDGTLIDSHQDIVNAAIAAFHTLGLPPPPQDAVGKAIGKGLRNLFGMIVGDADGALLDRLVVTFREHYAQGYRTHTKVFAGILDVLESYGDREKIVVTNKSQLFADKLVDAMGLRKYFTAVFGQEAFPKFKPDPEPLLGVAQRWNLPVDRIALIGDSIYDVTCAKSAGAISVAVTWGYGTLSVLEAAKPDFIVDTPRKLIGLLK